MTRQKLLREAIKRPLMFPYHPLYRFYKGGGMVRKFRSIPGRSDDWWSEDWVGSCTIAGNKGPDGADQGLSIVDVSGLGPVTLKSLVETFPQEILGERFVERCGTTTAMLVKILSPAGPVPLHVHPSRAWARHHLGSPFGKVEGWILLDTPGDGTEPAYFATGFKDGIRREWFRSMVESRNGKALREMLHRTEVHPGEVYVAYPGVPHCVGPQVLAIEVQEPTDHMVIAEWEGMDEAEATMGLGWDTALDIIDYEPTDQTTAVANARQQPSVLRRRGDNCETRLVNPDVLDFFDVILLEVADEIAVEDGRFSIDIITEGAGMIEGDFGTMPIKRGEAFACAASLGHRFRAAGSPLKVVRCMGPQVLKGNI
jgi:mannose-6-phosphate isomerase